ncbi:MAG: hypothetical protein U5J98_06995 [Halobacteriales archaeon]|nr:hypothetical protein [Halobacteriales archaeon]
MAQQDLPEGQTHQAVAGYEDNAGDYVTDGDVPDGGQFSVNQSWDESDGTNANY